jgi:hypothetical protein
LELNKLDGGGSHAAKRGEGPTATLVAYGTASGRLPHTKYVDVQQVADKSSDRCCAESVSTAGLPHKTNLPYLVDKVELMPDIAVEHT